MVTKSMSNTPYGKKLVYKIDGECIWSEYLPFRHAKDKSETIAFLDRAEGLLGNLRRGVRSVFLRRAS